MRRRAGDLARIAWVMLCAGCSTRTVAPTDAAFGDLADARMDVASGVGCDAGCGAGAWCDRGRCVCSSPQVYCAAVGCVDPTVDPAHCGGCATRCAAGAACRGGVCSAPCASGTHRCGGMCALDDDATRCGGQCARCDSPVHGAATCVLGGCSYTCGAGWHACTGGCFADDDVARCGARCEACPAPGPGVARCVGGACVPRCEAGAHACGGACVPDDAVASCGGRCEPCPRPEHGAAVCAAGACDFVCATGFRRCGDICSDGTSPLGCGPSCARCEAPDGAAAVCVAGACDFACFAGFHRCGSRCAPDNDPASCGDRCAPCDSPPNATGTCTAGRCDFACDAGFVRVAGACASIPRLVWPPSSARLSGRRPTFRWSLPADVPRVQWSLCRDRACASVIESHVVEGERFTPDAALDAGVLFWRVSVPSSERASATWRVRLAGRDATETAFKAAAMDVDADGFDDLAVGVPLAYAGQRVFVYRGGATGLGDAIATTLSAPAPDTDFGVAVQSVGDLDGDGFTDLAVGAPRDALGLGRVFVYRGGARGLADVPARTLTGADGTSGHFGASLAGVGDVDGDGYADLAVGAYGAAGGLGRVHVIYGGPDLLSARETVLEGTDPAGRFGFAVSPMGDVDGDGDADVAVGADGVGMFSGRVFLFRGGASGLGPAAVATLSVPGGSRFGAALAGVGDVDGDGGLDVLVGSLGESVGAGRAYVFSAAATGDHAAPTATLAGMDGERAAFGMTVAWAGDVDADGLDDVLVGAPQALDFTGRGYLFRGAAGALGRAPTVLLGPNESGAYYAGSMGAGRDVDGDGRDEFVIGAERAMDYAGRVELIGYGVAGLRTRVLFGPDRVSGRFGYALAMR